MRYDAIVIGAGQAGPGVAAGFASEGQQVALIEADRLGGTCLNYGCRPTKTLRMSARVAHMARRAAEYGVNVGSVNVDFAAVMQRKNEIIGGMQDGTEEYFHGLENVDIYYEYGRFNGKTDDGLFRVLAGEQELAASQVYINTGARAFIPPIDGIEDVPYLTNVEILALDALPEHLIVIGGSYIGLEFGQMFLRFGSKVTVIESSAHIASREDTDVSEELERFLREEGMIIHTNSRGSAVTKTADGIELTIADKTTGSEQTITGTHLLLATGRRPNTDKLNLESVGVETNERGYIVTDDKYATSVEGIWALGDVNGRGAFTHTSYQDYEIYMANRGGADRSADERYMTYAMFTDPPLGRVGMNEREVRDSDRNVLMAKLMFDGVSRAKLDSETDGIWKVLVDADTEEVLGATVLGMQGDDVVQIFSNFMYTGASYKVLRDALPVHPTVGEFIPTIMGMLEPLE